jgi:hypothetical protein
MDGKLVTYLESLNDEDYAGELDEICLALNFAIRRRDFAHRANVAVKQLPPPVLGHAFLIVAPQGTRHWN